MKIYTRTGDAGSTSLAGGERVSKFDPRVVAYGTVDELTAFVAYFRDSIDTAQTALDEYYDDLGRVLSSLMSTGAVLASAGTEGANLPSVDPEAIEYLEKRIDYITGELKPINSFTLPGGHPLVSLAHVCRTICRRAERKAVAVSIEYDFDRKAIVYLNRLSDYLYQLGRKLTEELSVVEQLWNP